MDWSLLLFLVSMVAVFWLLIIRPNQQRQKAAARLQGSLSVGDEVMLTSGVYGTVAEVGDDRLHIEVAPGVRIQVARGAVASMIHDEPATPEQDPEETTTEQQGGHSNRRPEADDDIDDEGER